MTDVAPRKEPVVKQEKPQDLAPWASKPISIGKEPNEAPWVDTAKEEPEKPPRPTRKTIFSLPQVGKGFLDEEDIPKEEKEAVRKAVISVRKARAMFLRASNALWGEGVDHVSAPPTAKDLEEGQETGCHAVSMKSYSAVGFGDTASDDTKAPDPCTSSKRKARPVYGLIDRGPGPVGSGTRCLVMHSHTARRNDEQQSATDRVRPGAVLRAVSVEDGGGSSRLRVRFITPEKYYAPGARVTTLRIGVDAVDWENLTPKLRRLI